MEASGDHGHDIETDRCRPRPTLVQVTHRQAPDLGLLSWRHRFRGSTSLHRASGLDLHEREDTIPADHQI
jgi:hypothetical protein